MMAKKSNERAKPNYTARIIIAAAILFTLFLISSCTALILNLGGSSLSEGNVAIIPISGVIMSENGGWGSDVASADDVVAWLEDARDDDSVKAVILAINSPGGSAVASDEIGTAVKAVREQNKTVVAWVREVGASGGYWVASASDHIIVNRMSITGSIGVIGSYFGFEEFIDDWNVTYRRFVSGERKDLGSPFRAMSADEQAFMQEKLDLIHEIFIDEVAANRGMDRVEVSKLATGEFYLGVEALEHGLVDELGGLDEALAYIEAQEDITAEPFWYANDPSLMEILYGLRNPATPFDALQEQGLRLR